MVGHEQRHGATTRQPSWIVQYVLGDETDPPFAYTVGLHDLGLPELFLAARPKQEDGGDWQLSSLDCRAELNRFARLLIEGSFLGREHVAEYDGGLTFCSYTVRPAVPQAQTLAYLASPRAQVVVIDGALSPAEGVDPVPLDADQDRRCRERLELLLARVDSRPPVPREPDRPHTDAEFDDGAKFGRMTPLVQAARLDLARLDADAIVRIGYLGHLIDHVGYLGHLRALLGAWAARTGRSSQLDAAEDLAYDLVGRQFGATINGPLWRQVLNRSGLTRRDDGPNVMSGLSGFVYSVVHAALAGEVLFDVLPLELSLGSTGLVEAAATDLLLPESDGYQAPAHITSVVRDLIGSLSFDRLYVVAGAWREKRREPDLPVGMMLAIVLPCIGSGRVPDVRVWLPDAPFDDEIFDEVTSFASSLAAVLSERPRLGSDQIDDFIESLEPVIPQLREVLDDIL